MFGIWQRLLPVRKVAWEKKSSVIIGHISFDVSHLSFLKMVFGLRFWVLSLLFNFSGGSIDGPLLRQEPRPKAKDRSNKCQMRNVK
jgi:hypothetical protein